MPGPEQPHFVRAYNALTAKLLASMGSRASALQAAVGSVSPEIHDLMGRIEAALLIYAGLRPTDSLIDVGCGSGRLAVHLASWLRGTYLGTDVVQPLLDHAAQECERPDWRFELVDGLVVPAETASADMACAFSVFTHLRHEESYLYLRDILRVLKPGGVLVYSYLDFGVPAHWPVFEASVASVGHDTVLNQFMGQDVVRAFAFRLGVELVEDRRADEEFIPVSAGAAAPELRALGQSVAIYRKPV